MSFAFFSSLRHSPGKTSESGKKGEAKPIDRSLTLDGERASRALNADRSMATRSPETN